MIVDGYGMNAMSWRPPEALPLLACCPVSIGELTHRSLLCASERAHTFESTVHAARMHALSANAGGRHRVIFADGRS